MNKKIWSMLAAGAMMATMLGGCASTEKEAENREKMKNDGEPVTITFWSQSADEAGNEAYNHLIEQFEAENPDIKVNFVPIPGDQSKAKYDVAIQSGTTPDCGGVTQYWMTDFIVQDALMPLDDYISKWDEKDGIIDMVNESIKGMAPDGKVYALGQVITLPVTWYNTGIYEQHNIAVPENWDDVLKAVELTTDKENGVYGFSLRGGAGNSQQFEQMMYQYSGITDMFDENGNSTVNDPLHVEFLEKFASIYNVYTPESDITNGYTEMVSAFDSGSAAAIFHNLGSYGQHRDTLGVGNFAGLTALKSVKGNSLLVSNGANCLAVFNNSEHPEEAFRFISFLAGHEGSSYFSEYIGQIPCSSYALQDDWINEAQPVQEMADALLNAETEMATLPINVVGYYDLHNNVLTEGFQEVLLGQLSAQDYLDNWASEMTRLKQEYDEYLESLK